MSNNCLAQRRKGAKKQTTTENTEEIQFLALYSDIDLPQYVGADRVREQTHTQNPILAVIPAKAGIQ